MEATQFDPYDESYDEGPGDMTECWLLSPLDRRLPLELIGGEVPGLRVGLSRTFIRWPSFWSDGANRTGRYALTGPRGTSDGVFRARGGRVSIMPDEVSAGLYRLREELLRRVNVAVYPAKVDAVLFKEIVVQ